MHAVQRSIMPLLYRDSMAGCVSVTLLLLFTIAHCDPQTHEQLSLIRLPASSAARNLALASDGSPYAYYYRRGVEDKTWVFILEASSWCTDARSCEQRAAPVERRGTSAKQLSQQLQGTGFAGSHSPFKHANIVVLPHLTSDAFLGNTSTLSIAAAQRSPLQFRGKSCLMSVLDDVARRGVTAPFPPTARVHLVGVGLAGLAVLLLGNDFGVRLLQLRPEASLSIISDGGFVTGPLPSEGSSAGQQGCPLCAELAAGIKWWAAKDGAREAAAGLAVDSECLRALQLCGSPPLTCAFSPVALAALRFPSFVLTWAHDVAVDGPLASTISVHAQLRFDVLQRHASFVPSRVGDGPLTACNKSGDVFGSLMAGGTTLGEALQSWLARTSARHAFRDPQGTNILPSGMSTPGGCAASLSAQVVPHQVETAGGLALDEAAHEELLGVAKRREDPLKES